MQDLVLAIHIAARGYEWWCTTSFVWGMMERHMVDESHCATCTCPRDVIDAAWRGVGGPDAGCGWAPPCVGISCCLSLGSRLGGPKCLTLPVGPRHLKLHRLHAIIWISTWLQKQLQEEGSGAWPPMSNDMSHSLRFNHRYLVLCGHLKFLTGSLLFVTMFFLFPRHLPVACRLMSVEDLLILILLTSIHIVGSVTNLFPTWFHKSTKSICYSRHGLLSSFH
jgi:hypothetical protein